MLDIQLDHFPELQTDRLLLNKMTMDDVPEMFGIRSDAQVMKYINRPLAETHADVEKLITSSDELFAQNEGISWAIRLKDSPTLIGNIGFWRMDKPNYRTEIGYLLSTAQQNKGIMSEALQCVLQYGFDVLGFHSIFADIDPLNEASVKLVQKLGMVQEAFFKENLFYEGKFIDTVIYTAFNPKSKA
jgi:[ribosomal protein S5]-alanine N-acetyltransferase